MLKDTLPDVRKIYPVVMYWSLFIDDETAYSRNVLHRRVGTLFVPCEHYNAHCS